MLPDTPHDGLVHVTRTVRAHPDDVADALADFIDAQDLEVDRSDAGEGTLFRPRATPDGSGSWFFGADDSLRVVVEPASGGTSVRFAADMRGMHQRGQAWQRRRYVRGGLLSATFFALGISGLTHGVGVGDFAELGLGAWFASRTVRRARDEPHSREKIERDLVNALQRACDEMEYDD